MRIRIFLSFLFLILILVSCCALPDAVETAAPSRPVIRELPPETTAEPTTYPHTAWAGIDPERTVYVSDRSGTVHSTSTCSGMKHYSACPAYEAYHTHRPLCEHCWTRDVLSRNK